MERKIKMLQKIPQAGKSIRAERYVGYKNLVLVIIGVFHILHSILFYGIYLELVCRNVKIRKIPEIDSALIV